MAEDSPITGGTVLEKHFGEGAFARSFGDVAKTIFGSGAVGGVGVEGYLAQAGTQNVTLAGITPQQIYDLSRSSSITADERTALQSMLLGRLGTQGYMALNPEMYAMGSLGYGYMSPWEMEIASLSAMSRQLKGIGGTFARWMIDNRIRELEYKVNRDLVGRGAREVLQPLKLREAPIPDWMRPYIAEGIPYKTPESPERGGGRGSGASRVGKMPTGTGQLRPISAQEKLTPDQMALMGAYDAWGRMGFPTSMVNVDKQALMQGLMNTAGWDTLTALSQKLFPSQQRLGNRWGIAQQR